MKFLQSFQKFIRAYHRLEVYGVENIPKEKSAVIAANHSGAWDIDTFILSTLFAPGRWIHILYADIFTLLLPLPLKIKIHFGKQMLFDKYYDKDLTKDNLYELADTVRTEIIKPLRLRGKNANDICKR